MNGIVYALAKVLVEIVIFLTAPLVLALVPKSVPRLPGLLALYQDYNYGLDGDEYWVNPTLADHPPTAEAAKTWLWRLRWCWRNANTWDHWFGLDTRTVVRVEFVGDPLTSNRPGHSGRLEIRAYDHGGRRHDCLYLVRQHGESGRCQRLYAGYKLKDLLDHHQRNGGNLDPALMDAQNLRRIAPRVWSWNPLMGFAK